MRNLKVLTLITGIMISSMGFGMEGGGGGSKVSSETQTSRERDKQNLTMVLGKWLKFYCPPAKNLLIRSVLGFPQAQGAPVAPANTMHISVEAAGSGVILIPSLDVDPNDTIASVKERVATQRNITASQVRLFVGQNVDQELTDNTQTLKDAGVRSGATLVLVIKNYKEVQKHAMAKLYSLSQSPAVRDFDLNSPVSEWPGVRGVDEEGRITVLNLSFNQLTGAIPSEIGELTALTYLGLSYNQLIGEIPTQIGQLTALRYLNMERNKLTGPIPPEIGELTELTCLYLSNNQLTGEIPSEIGELTALTFLYLSNNQLTGEIPSEIGHLTALTYLYLDNNQLTDVDAFKNFIEEKIPDCCVDL